MALKWVRKLSPLTASTTKGGAQALNRSRTRGKPLNTKPRHTTALSTKAMTWFLVSAEKQDPMARKAPAISALPR